MSENKEPFEIVPATDILEMADGFHVIMDMPGVPTENLTVDLEENQLSIKGVSVYEDKCPGNAPDATGATELVTRCNHMHSEFAGAVYTRTFTLSDLVDRDQISATLKDGVLRLFLPKAAAMQPRRIKIS